MLSRNVVFSILQNNNHCIVKSCIRCTQIGRPERKKLQPIRKGFLGLYDKLLQRFEKALSKHPRVFDQYTVTKNGITDLIEDSQLYATVAPQLWAGRPMSELSYKELTVYKQMPNDMIRAIPVLFFSIVPFGWIFFFLAFKFPRYFLTTHFMSLEEREQVWSKQLKKKLRHYPGVVDHLTITSKGTLTLDTNTFNKLVDICLKLDVGMQVSVEEIISIQNLFQINISPLKLENIHFGYRWKLQLARNVARFNIKSLPRDLVYFTECDRALKEIGVHSLTKEQLIWACQQRGMCTIDTTSEEQIKYLQDWMSVFDITTRENISLYLHLPMLLAYNLPSNVQFMGPKWKNMNFRRVSRDGKD